jgi:DNA polymerase
MFDMAILNWHYGIRPKRIADTLSMARAIHGLEVGGSLKALAEYYNLGAKGDEVVRALGKQRKDFTATELDAYGRYCCQDTCLTYNLFACLAEGYPLNELKLIDLTIRMFTEPVLELVQLQLAKHLGHIREEKENLLGRIGASKDELMSNPKLAAILQSFGIDPPLKISPTTGKETYAFAKSDEEFTTLLEHPFTAVQALIAARLGVKSTLEETRTERFIGIAGRGLLPVPLRYYAAHTGRWGGDDKVNLQNLGRGSALKKCIYAPNGYVLINSDSSQIEARTLAWLAGQDDLVAAFDAGKDVYRTMASYIYEKDEDDISKVERHVGKTVILGAGYGIGAAKLQNALKTGVVPVNVSLERAQYIVDVYRSTYSCIPELWTQAGTVLRAIMADQSSPFGLDGVLSVEGVNGIRLPNGLYLRYPNLRREQNRDTGEWEMVYDNRKGRTKIATKIYGGKCVENVTQALARIVIGEQMLMISQKYKVAMTVHDSVVAVMPDHEKEMGKEFVELCMRMRPSWALDLPLNCEAGVGLNYGTCG